MTRLIVLLLLMVGSLCACDRFVTAQGRVDRAEQAQARGEHRVAVVELRNALKKDPSLAQANVMLAESLLWLGDAAGAERELKQIQGTPDNSRLNDIEIRLLLARGRNEEVLARLQADPPLAAGRARLHRGTALLSMRQGEAARREFAAAVEADHTMIAAHVGAIEALALTDRAASVSPLESLTKQFPESALVWLTYGNALLSMGDSKRAVNALTRARDLATPQLEIVRQAGLLAALTEAQLMERNLEEARETSAALGRLVPHAPVSLIIASRVEMAANNYPGAVATLRRVIQQAPDLLQARYLLAMGLLAQGNLEQASAELSALMQRAPDHIGARQLLAQVRMRLDDPDGALRLLVPTLDADAEGLQVNALIDAARSRIGATQSVTLLERMLEQEPQNRGLQAQLAAAYLQAGQPAKAAALLRDPGPGRDATSQRRAALLVEALEASEGANAARARIDAMVSAEPGNPFIVQLAASHYASEGNFEAARRVIERGERSGIPPRDLLFTRAQIEWSSGQRKAAAAALDELLASQPGNAIAHMAAGEIALGSGDIPGARRHFQAVREMRKDSLDARLRLAQLALSQGDGAEADKLIAEILALAPNRPEVRNSIGALLLGSGRSDQAVEHLREATRLDAPNPASWLNLGRAQRGLGQASAARDSFERALRLRPRWLPAEAALVSLDIEERRPDAALARVTALRKGDERNPAIRLMEGDMFAALQRFSDAEAAYRAAYDLRASGAVAIKFYQLRVAAGGRQPAELLVRWLASHPGDLSVRVLVAEDAMRSGNYAAAIDHYRTVLDARPRDALVLNNLAWLLHETGDKRGIELAREAVKYAPESPAVNDTLGWLLVQEGEVAEGLAVLSRAVEQKNVSDEIRYHHAYALARNGASAEAVDRLEALLRESSGFPSRGAAERLLKELSARPNSSP